MNNHTIPAMPFLYHRLYPDSKPQEACQQSERRNHPMPVARQQADQKDGTH